MMTTSHRKGLILAHLPQVELLARRLHRRCPRLELDHLISAGTIGLIQAVDSFDPSRNLKLKTLAGHRIRSAICAIRAWFWRVFDVYVPLRGILWRTRQSRHRAASHPGCASSKDLNPASRSHRRPRPDLVYTH